MIRLTVPAPLPSTRTSRGLDDHGVGDRRVGDRDARDVELGREHRRPTGREQHPFSGIGPNRWHRLRLGLQRRGGASSATATADGDRAADTNDHLTTSETRFAARIVSTE